MPYGEAGVIQKLFGNRERDWAVPVSYMKVLFEEEGLPITERWNRGRWWFLGLVESLLQAK